MLKLWETWQLSLGEEKNELGLYTTNLNSQIVQIGSQLPNPDNHPLLTALRQEANRATKKLHEMVG